MDYTYHHTLPSNFRSKLQSLIGNKLLNISSKQLLVSITKSGNTIGSAHGEKVRICFEVTDNQYVTMYLDSENYETFIGEDVDYFSKCTVYNECVQNLDLNCSFGLYYDFIIESIKVYGKKRNNLLC